ncbi:hypothetical protein [Streptomyces sp. NRRL S-350]|uniref:hypothetical protein n=1 Tax=Streptomyces sp. NRRL S-350 TaxID=1463902 RepID=UPI0004BFDAD0|nr:hypothetical protein [Streptomyces sp. NRRL S-350]
MFKLRATGRAIAMSAAALTLAGGATVGLGGTADAAVGSPNQATTDWFQLYVSNNGNNPYYTVCNHQSGANTVYVGVTDYGSGNNVLLQDTITGWQTYGTNINFNAGGCESFFIKGTNGHAYIGYIKAPTYYSTGVVTYN